MTARYDERTAVRLLKAMPEELAWNGGIVLYELRAQRKEDGWLVILKGKKGPDYLVAFLKTEAFGDALLLAALLGPTQDVAWHEDRYPPRTNPLPP